MMPKLKNGSLSMSPESHRKSLRCRRWSNLRALHHRLGGAGDGPFPYGDLFMYIIPDQGPVKITKSRYGS